MGSSAGSTARAVTGGIMVTTGTHAMSTLSTGHRAAAGTETTEDEFLLVSESGWSAGEGQRHLCEHGRFSQAEQMTCMQLNDSVCRGKLLIYNIIWYH